MTVTAAWFFAAERSIDGPPMSICSIASSSVVPGRATVSRNGIEVHDHEVDRLDAVLAHRRHVRREVAAAEEAAVDLRVQRLHAAVEHLGEAGVVAHLRAPEAGVGEQLRRAAGRQDLDAERREPARELDQRRACR